MQKSIDWRKIHISCSQGVSHRNYQVYYNKDSGWKIHLILWNVRLKPVDMPFLGLFFFSFVSNVNCCSGRDVTGFLHYHFIYCPSWQQLAIVYWMRHCLGFFFFFLDCFLNKMHMYTKVHTSFVPSLYFHVIPHWKKVSLSRLTRKFYIFDIFHKCFMEMGN